MIEDGRWDADPERSRIGFVASHVMGLGKVNGRFRDFTAQITVAGGELSDARASISAASIETGNDRRDADLRSGAFLDAETHPEIAFAASEIESLGDGRYRVNGTLTVKGNTAEVPLDAKVLESEGAERRLRALGTFDRRDVGVRPGAKALIVGRIVGVEIEFVALPTA